MTSRPRGRPTCTGPPRTSGSMKSETKCRIADRHRSRVDGPSPHSGIGPSGSLAISTTSMSGNAGDGMAASAAVSGSSEPSTRGSSGARASAGIRTGGAPRAGNSTSAPPAAPSRSASRAGDTARAQGRSDRHQHVGRGEREQRAKRDPLEQLGRAHEHPALEQGDPVAGQRRRRQRVAQPLQPPQLRPGNQRRHRPFGRLAARLQPQAGRSDRDAIPTRPAATPARGDGRPDADDVLDPRQGWQRRHLRHPARRKQRQAIAAEGSRGRTAR